MMRRYFTILFIELLVIELLDSPAIEDMVNG